jgi:hypothetical protein
VIPAMAYPRASEHVTTMIEMINSLLLKEYAFMENGSVLFDVTKDTKYNPPRTSPAKYIYLNNILFSDFISLVMAGLEDSAHTIRILKNLLAIPARTLRCGKDIRCSRCVEFDFLCLELLWHQKKTKKQEMDGVIKWETPFGSGRPGWHIECSGMVKHFFNDTIDIHAGDGPYCGKVLVLCDVLISCSCVQFRRN